MSGPILAASVNLQLQALEDEIVRTPAFQAARPGEDEAALRDAVYWDHVTLANSDDDRALAELRPFVIIRTAEQGANILSEGVAIDLQAGWGFLIGVEQAAQYTANHKHSLQAFNEFWGGLLDALDAGSGERELGYSQRNTVLAARRTPRSERDEHNDYWQAVAQITLGVTE